MRRIHCALLGAIAVIGSASLGFAADMPVKAPMAAPVPFTWTGFYYGLNGGGGWTGTQDWNVGGFSIGTSDPKGAIFGGQVGYNWQFNNFLVLGVQADADWSDIEGSARNSFLDGRCAGGFSDQSADCRTKFKYLATLTGRVGFLPWQNTLIYGKAGVAWTTIDLNIDHIIDVSGGTCGPPGSTSPGYNTNRVNKAAFTAGGGIEARVTDMVTAFGEYDYVDITGTNTNLYTGGTGAGGCTPDFTATTNLKPLNIVKFGVNFKLN